MNRATGVAVRGPAAVALWALGACGGAAEREAASPRGPDTALTRPAAGTPALVQAPPDSTWIVVTQPMIVAFHPLASNEQLEADEGLATALDDLAFHLGTAMDSLVAMGVGVHYQPGDSVKLHAAAASHVFVRDTDSADVGYIFADTAGRRAVVYGVRSHQDLVAYARSFIRTGTVPPAP